MQRVATVATGNVASQIIALLAIPFLARIYSPSEFGIYGIYLAVIGVFQSLGTLRYDEAAIVAKDDATAIRLVSLALRVSVATSSLLAIAILILGVTSSILLMPRDGWIASTGAQFALLPIGVAVLAAFSVTRCISVRLVNFRAMSISLIVRTTSCAALQLIAGWSGAGAYGLILGSIVGLTLGAMTMVIPEPTWGFLVRSVRAESLGLLELAREYYDFAIYGTLNGVINSLSQNLPCFLLATFFGLDVAGAFTMAMRLVKTPLTVLSDSLRHVFYQRASETSRNGENVLGLVRRHTLILSVGLAALCAAFYATAPLLFSLVLGPSWDVAGQYAQWLILWGVFLVLNVPSVCVLKVARRQHVILVHQIGLLAVRTVVLIVAGMTLGAYETVALFAISSALMNGCLIAYVNLATRLSYSPCVST